MFADREPLEYDEIMAIRDRLCRQCAGEEVFSSRHSHRSLDGSCGYMRWEDACNNVLESQLEGYRRKLVEAGASDAHMEQDVRFVKHCMNILCFNGIVSEARE